LRFIPNNLKNNYKDNSVYCPICNYNLLIDEYEEYDKLECEECRYDDRPFAIFRSNKG